MISDYAKVSVQSSVSCCDFLFIPIVSVQWPMVGRIVRCHILSEKNVSTRSPNPKSTSGLKFVLLQSLKKDFILLHVGLFQFFNPSMKDVDDLNSMTMKNWEILRLRLLAKIYEPLGINDSRLKLVLDFLFPNF